MKSGKLPNQTATGVEPKSGNGPKPADTHEALSLLNVFVGKWNTTGIITREQMTIKGTDTYEWLDGGHFLIHHVDVTMGNEAMKTIEIIGYDSSRNIYTTRSFDSQGNSGEYDMTVDKGSWKIQGKSERATIIVEEGGRSMKINWEKRSNDSNWIPWIDMRLSK